MGWLLANDMCAFNKEPITTTIEITKDDNINTVSKKLKEEGLIEYRWFFKLFAGIRHAEDKIGIGKYELNSEMDYNALINGMRNKNATLNADTVKVSIPGLQRPPDDRAACKVRRQYGRKPFGSCRERDI